MRMSSKKPTVTAGATLVSIVGTPQAIRGLSPTMPSGLCDLTLPRIASPMYGRKMINRNSPARPLFSSTR